MRKFKILKVELNPGGPGPEYLWAVHYTAIVKKQWKNGQLWIIARNEKQAKERAMIRFGGK